MLHVPSDCPPYSVSHVYLRNEKIMNRAGVQIISYTKLQLASHGD